jgi:hypothetical protein
VDKVFILYFAVLEGEKDFSHVYICVIERNQVLCRDISSKLVIFLMQPSDIAQQKFAFLELFVLKPF